MYNICLVEDEKYLNNLIKSYLEREKYNVDSFYDGVTALEHVNNNYDLWIIDIMLGDSIMVAPQLKKGNKREVVIPEGSWVDELGNKYEEGVYEIEVPLSRLPVFTRVEVMRIEKVDLYDYF